MGFRTARHAVACVAARLTGATAASAETAHAAASKPATDPDDGDAGIDLLAELRGALGWDSHFDTLYERVFVRSLEPGSSLRARAGGPPNF